MDSSPGDFTVVYELNVHCSDVARINQHYSDLHGHIQDVFNAYGVQIMSPNYDRDPDQPKILRPDNLFIPRPRCLWRPRVADVP